MGEKACSRFVQNLSNLLFKKFKKSVENLELFVAGIEGGGEVSSERGEADDVGVEEDFDQV